MPGERAHVLEKETRTKDVIADVDITFKELLLSDKTQAGLEASGFKKPSPIQAKAIPLGRCGFDLIVQAKSGTGKTCVFTIVALEMVKTDLNRLQVLVLSPTREISVQIKDVISTIGQKLEGLKVSAFIGGLPIESDKKNLQKCHIAVGAPGRIKHLVTEGFMKLDAVRLFVLDEADKLMEESFRSDVSFIFLHLPKTKQIIASSATYPSSLEEFVSRYTNNPTRISFGHGIFLKGIRQFVSVVPSHANLFDQTKIKEAELLRILSIVSFKQCLIFLNYQSRVESLCNRLKREGFHATFIGGFQSQMARLQSIARLKDFVCRVFVSTDLTSRGIDAENVNLVVNLDVPYDSSTYMHRIGRAGRFGTKGVAVSVVQSGTECLRFRNMLYEIGGNHFEIFVFPTELSKADVWQMNEDEFERMSVVEKDGETKATFVEGNNCKKSQIHSGFSTNEESLTSVKEKEQNRNLESIVKLITEYSKTIDVELKTIDELREEEKKFAKDQTKSNGTEEFTKKGSMEWKRFPKGILYSLSSFEKDDWKKFQFDLMNSSSEKDSNCTSPNKVQKSFDGENQEKRKDQKCLTMFSGYSFNTPKSENMDKEMQNELRKENVKVKEKDRDFKEKLNAEDTEENEIRAKKGEEEEEEEEGEIRTEEEEEEEKGEIRTEEEEVEEEEEGEIKTEEEEEEEEEEGEIRTEEEEEEEEEGEIRTEEEEEEEEEGEIRTEEEEEEEEEEISDSRYNEFNNSKQNILKHSKINRDFNSKWFAAWQAQANAISDYVDFVKTFHRTFFT